MLTNSTSILKKLLLVFLIVAGLYFAQSFLIPLTIGAVLAMLFLPFCRWMESKKIHRGFAAFICLLILLLVITGIAALLGWQISGLTTDFALVKQIVIKTIGKIQYFIFNNINISPDRQTELLGNGQAPGGIIQTMAGSVLTIFTHLIFVLAYVFLLLYYRNHIKQFILKLAPDEQRNEVGQILKAVANVSNQYLVGLAKMIFCLWIMYGIGFSVLGIENALFFAILCGLLEIIPFVGNLTGTTLTLLVVLVSGASPMMLFGIVCTYGIVQFIQGWILEPLILGPQVKINPLFTILALVVGQLVWGLAGIFLAIPIIAMFKIVCDHIETLKPYGFLIGEIQTVKKESAFIRKIKNWFHR